MPFRQDNIRGYKTLITDHDCSLTDQCFKEHIEETGINQQAFAFMDQWKRETGEDFIDEEKLLQKYICWNYCCKVLQKYSCGERIYPNTVIKKFLEWREGGYQDRSEEVINRLHKV